MSDKTKKICCVGMLCAVAYLVLVLVRIPVILFLKYEAKDVIIVIGGLIFGPAVSLIISMIVSFIEFLTVSTTGVWGLVMNVLSTCSFACTAAYIYKKKHTLKGAAMGLSIGVVFMVIVMLLWNYLITPIYMGYPRAAVAAMLIPAFLPFNLFKGLVNMALTLLLYKPVVSALRKASLIPAAESTAASGGNKVFQALPLIIALVATAVLVYLVMKGII